jgi:nitrogen fixation NifU-like protein
MSTRTYSRTVIDHFRNPRNQRKLDAPDGVGWAINHACSDVVRMFVQVQDGTVTACTFQAQGCAACVAAASVTTELVCGKPVADAKTLPKDAVVAALGGLPEAKVQCSVIAPEAVAAALADAEQRAG